MTPEGVATGDGVGEADPAGLGVGAGVTVGDTTPVGPETDATEALVPSSPVSVAGCAFTHAHESPRTMTAGMDEARNE